MKIKRVLVVAVYVFAALCLAPAYAMNNSGGGAKTVDKGMCELAGGTYSEGKNYTRCEYPNGDSYTCNSDVNKCESCTNGKCTVELKPGSRPAVPAKPLKAAPQRPSGGQASPPQPIRIMKKLDKASP